MRRGWDRGVYARYFGMRDANWRKAFGKQWIYPTEQLRLSRQLKRVIAGEIVLAPRLKKNGQPYKREHVAVLAAQPVPLAMPMKLTFDFAARRFRMVPQRQPQNPLPSFQTLLGPRSGC